MICKLNFWLMLQPQLQILELSNTSPERSQSDLCLSQWLWRGEGRGGSPCPGIALLAWNALGNVQRGVWLVRSGVWCVDLCVCVCADQNVMESVSRISEDRSAMMWSAGWQPGCVGVSVLPVSCLHLVVVASANPTLLSVYMCVCMCVSLRSSLCETRSASSTSGQQSTDWRLIRPLALQVDLWTSARFLTKMGWAAVLGQPFAGSSQAITSYLCFCQWAGSLQGLQTSLAGKHRCVCACKCTQAH